MLNEIRRMCIHSKSFLRLINFPSIMVSSVLLLTFNLGSCCISLILILSSGSRHVKTDNLVMSTTGHIDRYTFILAFEDLMVGAGQGWHTVRSGSGSIFFLFKHLDCQSEKNCEVAQSVGSDILCAVFNPISIKNM